MQTNIAFILILNIVVWIYVIMFLNRGKQIVYECEVGLKNIIAIIFFAIALFQYLSNRNIYTLITFASISLAGILYCLVPSGFGQDGFIILGRKIKYKDIDDIKVEKYKGRLQIMIEHKRKIHYLFQKLENEDKVKRLIKKYYH